MKARKHYYDIQGHIRDSIVLRAANLMACDRPETVAVGRAIHSQQVSLSETVLERLLIDYTVTRKPRTERTV